jgi:hypothetical protein
VEILQAIILTDVNSVTKGMLSQPDFIHMPGKERYLLTRGLASVCVA